MDMVGVDMVHVADILDMVEADMMDTVDMVNMVGAVLVEIDENEEILLLLSRKLQKLTNSRKTYKNHRFLNVIFEKGENHKY